MRLLTRGDKSAFLAACCIGLLPLSAVAIPITATETVFTFDLSGLTPSPPYTNIEFGAIFSSTDPVTVNVDTMLTKVYGGLNGAQLLQTRNDTAPGFFYDTAFSQSGTVYGPLTTANAIFNPMLDGTFSFGLQMTSGSADLISFSACGLTNGIRGPCLALPVPEPSAAMFFLVGLAALSLARVATKKHGINQRPSSDA